MILCHAQAFTTYTNPNGEKQGYKRKNALVQHFSNFFPEDENASKPSLASFPSSILLK